ncbi:hypothetical protein AVEN_92730-1 [Araneus ventricosus]|uniref:Uncharacterized protein n=1 Tax=Araneus ventricosus TaxID=182803 RepID=A0A4Y2IDB9_ARAVE|nr:hypothetical protein AVEN_92730-1 [Araneus ventricosus]
MESSPRDTTWSALSSRPAAYGIGRLVGLVLHYAMLRKDMICPIFVSGCDMPKNILLTYGNVIRCVVFCHSKKNRSKRTVSTTTLSSSCEEVANKLEETLKRASIPIIDQYSILRKIRSYHEKYSGLLKSYKARKDVENYRKQVELSERKQMLYLIYRHVFANNLKVAVVRKNVKCQ